MTTHGYGNTFGEDREWTSLLQSGVATLVAVATDWIFGTTTTPPVTGGGWWKKPTRRWWEEDDEEWLLL